MAYRVIESFIKANKECDYENVVKELGDVLKRGKIKIVDRKEDVENDPKLKVRYFRESIMCGDEEILITNQWGKGNIQGMIEKAKELGMTIELQ